MMDPSFPDDKVWVKFGLGSTGTLGAWGRTLGEATCPKWRGGDDPTSAVKNTRTATIANLFANRSGAANARFPRQTGTLRRFLLSHRAPKSDAATASKLPARETDV